MTPEVLVNTGTGARDNFEPGFDDVRVQVAQATYGEDDQALTLVVRVTEEGLIYDLVDENGEVVGTDAATFNEIAERLAGY